ncbi:MAG TPA: hypothetical protein VFA20_17955 [Myxococcaceae bacterium]|nr:hypothetical protein [Myxococcaceae bacterium]
MWRLWILHLVDLRRRALWQGLACVAVTAALALRFPFVSLWLGAALLGVPHLISGVRHLAVRRRLAATTWIAVGGAMLIGVVQLFDAGTWTTTATSLCFAVAMGSEALAGRGANDDRRLPLLGMAALYGTAAVLWPLRSLIVLSHAHAIGSMACLALLARRRAPLAWVPMAAAAAVMVAAFAGAFDAWLPAAPYAPPSSAESLATARILAAFPGASGLTRQRGLFAYAFGQALHYSVWVRLVPDVDRPAAVPQTFRVAWSRLRADLGRWALPLAVACAVAPAVILIGGTTARETYFTLAYFHIGLEAAALVALLRGL